MYATKLKVYGFQCDLFGHVNNARYLEFLEQARWDWLNKITTFSFFTERKMSFVVAAISINYRYPCVLNDELTVTVEVSSLGNRSATVHQVITRNTDNKLVADADVTFALVNNTTGKSVELDDELKALLSA